MSSHSTLAIYMPGNNYFQLARQLREAGLSLQTPCAVVSHAGRPTQQVRVCDLLSLERMESLAAPTLLIVGECVNPMRMAQHCISDQSLIDEPQTTARQPSQQILNCMLPSANDDNLERIATLAQRHI